MLILGIHTHLQTQWDIPEELAGNEQVMGLMVVEEEGGEEEMDTQTSFTTPGASYEEGKMEEGEEEEEEGAVEESQAEAEEQEDDEEGEWGEAQDEETGQVYYFNRRDGSTTWDKPEGFESKFADGEEGEEGEKGEEEEGEVEELEEGEVEEGELEEEEDRRLAQTDNWAWRQQAKERWTRTDEDQGGAAPATSAAAPSSSAEAGGGGGMTTQEYEEYMYQQKLKEVRERQRLQQLQLTVSPSASASSAQQQQQEEWDHTAAAAAAAAAATAAHEKAAEVAAAHREQEQQRKREEERDRKEAAALPSWPTAAKAAAASAAVHHPSPPRPSPQKKATKSKEKEAAADSALEQAKALLCAEDSIMDPGIVAALTKYIGERGKAAGGEEDEDAMYVELEEMLAGNYRGLANMSLLMAGWLQDLAGDGTEPDLDAQELVLEHLKAQIKSNFDLDKADALLFGREEDRKFIDEMMEHRRWRRLLMEVFAVHKASKLLGGYCMQHLSRAGRNTEMADIISVEDYWSVARGVLTELLAEVPWGDHVDLWKLLTNLKRICCSTSYLHAFSQDVVYRLETELLAKAQALGTQEGGGGKEEDVLRAQSLVAATRKYRRIRQELEKASWETAEQGVGGAGANPLERSNRSRFVHKLSAWQKEAPLTPAEAQDPVAKERRQQLLDVLLAVFSARRLFDEALDVLLATYVDATVLFKEKEKEEEESDEEDELARVQGPLAFLRHPQLLDLLVKAVFDPKTRFDTPERRASACKVLTVASTALLDGSVDREEADALYDGLRQASNLLADEEMLRWNMCFSAMPPTLKGLLKQHPVVAMGFLHWLRVTIQDPEFHNSRQFNEVMQVFMRLLQFLVVERPLHQPAVFAALKALLTLKPTESSFNIIKMKRQALQCCVFLMSHGFVLPVLSFFHHILPDLDHALVRHFMGLTLVAAQPPYSPVFSRALASLLREVVVSKALRSNLEDTHKKALVAFIEEVCLKDELEELAKAPEDEKVSPAPSPAKMPGAARGDGEGFADDALLDPAMRKGLRLVYAHLIKRKKKDVSVVNGMEGGAA